MARRTRCTARVSACSANCSWTTKLCTMMWTPSSSTSFVSVTPKGKPASHASSCMPEPMPASLHMCSTSDAMWQLVACNVCKCLCYIGQHIALVAVTSLMAAWHYELIPMRKSITLADPQSGPLQDQFNVRLGCSCTGSLIHWVIKPASKPVTVLQSALQDHHCQFDDGIKYSPNLIRRTLLTLSPS